MKDKFHESICTEGMSKSMKTDSSLLRKLRLFSVTICIIAILSLGFIILIFPADWNIFISYDALRARRIIIFALMSNIVALLLLNAAIFAFSAEIKRQQKYFLESIEKTEKKLDTLENVILKERTQQIYERIYALEEKNLEI
ncbi:MAG: hypothetical protein FWF79_09190 [Defluviitaleaceae bacterium]|nr:hypothetical protein [Defluviitaleaceae bacterium]